MIALYKLKEIYKMIATQEIWKKINYPNIKNCYEISSHGNFKNININKPRKLKLTNGYLTTKIGLTTKQYQDKSIHRLVAEAFIENIHNKEYVNHKDGNKKNNNVDNLEWMTQKENVNHSINTGLINPRSRPVKQFTLTGEFIKEFNSTTNAGLSIGLSRSSIEKVCDYSNPTAGGYKWKYSIPNEQCDLTNAKNINDYPRYKITPTGKVYSIKYKRIMKLQTNANGYQWIQFSIDSQKKNYYIHQLVAIHYINNPENKPFVNHKDGNKINNHIDNLEWVTQSENTQHYYNELRKVQS
jgi:hypothetical protein